MRLKMKRGSDFPVAVRVGKCHSDGCAPPDCGRELTAMSGAELASEAFDLVALLNSGDLTARGRRIVFDVIVNAMIEDSIPDRESVVALMDLVAGRLSGDEYRQRIFDRYTSVK